MTPPRRNCSVGFTLVEMLTVIAIISLLTGLSISLTRSLTGSGQTNTAIAQLSGTVELARAYAMSNHTYVRMGLANLPVQTGVGTPSLAVVVIAATDGSLANDTATAMANSSQWNLIIKPLVLNNLWNYDALKSTSTSVDTTNDQTPSATDIAVFSRSIGTLGAQSFPGPSGGGILQFNPDGEARVIKASPARYIKIGLDQPAQPGNPGAGYADHNPFVLRVSGINGSVAVLRKESLN